MHTATLLKKLWASLLVMNSTSLLLRWRCRTSAQASCQWLHTRGRRLDRKVTSRSFHLIRRNTTQRKMCSTELKARQLLLKMQSKCMTEDAVSRLLATKISSISATETHLNVLPLRSLFWKQSQDKVPTKTNINKAALEVTPKNLFTLHQCQWIGS
jgi:hypothetical protein